MKLHATVRLKIDVPEQGLLRGAVGVIVFVFDTPRRAYEVEFADAEGRTIAELALREDDLEEICP